MLDGLERIQACNRLEEMRQEALRFLGLLEAWTVSGDEDLKAELKAMPMDEG